MPQHSAEVQRRNRCRADEREVGDPDSPWLLGRDRNFTGFHFWARGYCVSTVGLDEQLIREYIRNQEDEEKREEQLTIGGLQPPSLPNKGR